MTSASLLIVLLVGTVVGALTGMVIGPSVSTLYLAIFSGFLGAIAATIVRNFLLAGKGADDSRTPVLVAVYAVIASLAGSVAAKEVADFSEITAPAGIGGLAGLFAALLLAMMMIVYHTHPGETPKLRKRRR